MFRLSRNAILIGVSCVVVGIAYGVLAPVFHYKVELAGVTMLIALGVAMAIMVAVLDTGGE